MAVCRYAVRSIARHLAAPAVRVLVTTPLRALSYDGGGDGASWAWGGAEGRHGGGSFQQGRGGLQPRGQERRPGDWDCPECGNHVFGTRNACPRCQTPKPYMEGRGFQGGGGGGGGYVNYGGGGSTEGYNTSHRERAPTQRKRGDWECPTCDFNNFASRQECFRCHAARPHDVAVFGGDDGGSPPGRGVGWDDQGWASNAYANRQREPIRPKRGDWECPSCTFHNFANRQDCFKCHAPRPHDVKVFTGEGGDGGDGPDVGRGEGWRWR